MLHLALWLVASLLVSPALAQEDVAPGAPTFKEGDTISFDRIDSLKPYLPPEFWDNRDFFFYEGMQLEIGPFDRDYAEPAAFEAATQKHKGSAKVGPEESLTGYVSGRPFAGAIDCKGDPQAGAKIAWNFDWRWQGDGSDSRYYYSYWDRGEELPLYYEGTSKIIKMSGRETKNDDTWVYVPTLRRVRRISSAQRTDAVSGTDFTLDDLRSFDGIVPQYKWQCLGADIPMLAPMNSRVEAYPYSRDHNFGPYGLSYADDRWELRKAYKVRFTPNNADHPYSKKDIYIDMQTYEPFYSFAYDRKNELWKIITHNHRWSEDNLPGDAKKPNGRWYEGWPEVPDPRDNRANSDIIVNVQTGTGNRIEYWDNHGTPFASKGKIRRYIDIGRLTKGR